MYSYGDDFAEHYYYLLILYVAIGVSVSRAKQVYWLNFNMQRS